ncbi:DUF1670 domain-containing protein [Candidatus Aerophobetes bacterium]|uniref:DUF1670 domain-containing protein n=1 Tax=Aerophobetes bacterium TaxID=2030807 RepID=A0A523W4H0_UNCAE|nr:MAG: DUF1670 domain-containing protein [Candidatus Aerophobetes bacterium]
MIITSSQRKVDLEERLQSKTVEQMFLTSVEEGANCPPFVARAILDVAKSTFNVGNGAEHEVEKTRPGQMKVLGICASEPAGKPLKECRLSDAVLTLDAGGEDQVIRLTGGKSGVTDLRRKRLLRISSEALEQGVLLTREDIAYRILNCGTRTITRDVKYFQGLGIQVPLRGYCKDIGPALTHKTQIVEHFIKRMQPTQIARRTYHSLEAVERYILHFAKVGYLSFHYEKKLSASDIAFVVGISERLVREYQVLYQRYSCSQKKRLREIVSLAKDPPKLETAKKGGTQK